MCGRFVRITPITSIVEIFHVESPSFDLSASYNIAPSQDIVIVNDSGRRELVRCRWGFLPPWIKDIAEGSPMINARAETIYEKASFKEAFRKQRCLIIADGFYEWKREKQKKTPFYIRLKSAQPMGFAGIYNYRSSPEGDKICGCAIITTWSNDLVASIHDRMPVLVPQEKVDMWLDPSCTDYEALKAMLRPYPSEDMTMHKVSNTVNSPTFDSESNILPIE